MKRLLIILFLSFLSIHITLHAEERSVLARTMDSFIGSILSNDRQQVYLLKDSIDDLLSHEFKSYRKNYQRLTDIYMANYKHNLNEHDSEYYRYILWLCHYDVGYLSKCERDTQILWHSVTNLLCAKVLIDFAEFTVHKPEIYLADMKAYVCLHNIDSSKVKFTDADKADLNMFGLDVSDSIVDTLEHRLESSLKTLKEENWYQILLNLDEADYQFFSDFKEWIWDFWKDGVYYRYTGNRDIKDKPSLYISEGDYLWTLGFYLDKTLSFRYSSLNEFKRIVYDMYRKGAEKTAAPEALLLQINKDFEINPDSMRRDFRVKEILDSVKNRMSEGSFAHWKGYDSLAEYVEGDDESAVLQKLDYYGKILLGRSYDLDKIILKSHDLLNKLANGKTRGLLKGNYVSMPQKIAMCRRLRDIHENYFESKKGSNKDRREDFEKERNKLHRTTLALMVEWISQDDGTDLRRYISPKEKDELIELPGIMGYLSAISTCGEVLTENEINNKMQEFDKYSKVLTLFDEKDLLACHERFRQQIGLKQDSTSLIKILDNVADYFALLMDKATAVKNLYPERYMSTWDMKDLLRDLAEIVMYDKVNSIEDNVKRFSIYCKAIRYLNYGYIADDLTEEYKEILEERKQEDS